MISTSRAKCTPRGSCNNTLLRRALRRVTKGSVFERVCRKHTNIEVRVSCQRQRDKETKRQKDKGS